MYSGWADPVSPPLDAIDYYKRVEQATGGQQKTESFFRLFMVPGMAHCGGGPGPNLFGGYGPPSPVSPEIRVDPQHDVLSALVQWVERGIAPDYFIASHVTEARIDRSRPVCRYPKVACWTGSGSTDDAKNFTCVEGPGPSPNPSARSRH
jgi:feruloyl esterase